MSTDEDDTDRWRNPRRGQTANDRDLAARRRNAPALGVPVLQVVRERDPEVTSPFDLLERDPDDEVHAVVQRSLRNSEDPATFGDIAKLAVALTRERSANVQRERDAEVVLAGPHKAHRATRRHLIATIVAAAVAAGSALKPIITPAAPAPEAGESVRVEELRHAVDRLDIELREMRAALRRAERNP